MGEHTPRLVLANRRRVLKPTPHPERLVERSTSSFIDCLLSLRRKPIMHRQHHQFFLWKGTDKDKNMPPNRPASPATKPLPALALPGMYLVYKYNEYKRQRQEQHRRKVTERELDHLNHKIVSS